MRIIIIVSSCKDGSESYRLIYNALSEGRLLLASPHNRSFAGSNGCGGRFLIACGNSVISDAFAYLSFLIWLMEFFRRLQNALMSLLPAPGDMVTANFITFR